MMIRDVEKTDFARIVALNDSEVQQTSPMDIEKLNHLDTMADYHKVAVVNGQIIAFLLAMRDGVLYESDNYIWFASRYNQFLYIDRVVVDASYAGQGVGGQLYSDLFAYARSQTIPVIVCEYNIEPPNLASKKFHQKLGFTEVGKQHVADGAKLVSLQAKEL